MDKPKPEATGGVRHVLLWLYGTVELKSENRSPMSGTPDNRIVELKLRVSFSEHGECSTELCLKPVDKTRITIRRT